MLSDNESFEDFVSDTGHTKISTISQSSIRLCHNYPKAQTSPALFGENLNYDFVSRQAHNKWTNQPIAPFLSGHKTTHGKKAFSTFSILCPLCLPPYLGTCFSLSNCHAGGLRKLRCRRRKPSSFSVWPDFLHTRSLAVNIPLFLLFSNLPRTRQLARKKIGNCPLSSLTPHFQGAGDVPTEGVNDAPITGNRQFSCDDEEEKRELFIPHPLLK